MNGSGELECDKDRNIETIEVSQPRKDNFLYQKVERINGVNNDSKVFGQSNWKNEVTY